MMRRRHFNVINYIEDILAIDVPSKIQASFDTLRQLLDVLRFDISLKKLEKPSTRLNCVGILVDTDKFTLLIPAEKLN